MGTIGLLLIVGFWAMLIWGPVALTLAVLLACGVLTLTANR